MLSTESRVVHLLQPLLGLVLRFGVGVMECEGGGGERRLIVVWDSKKALSHRRHIFWLTQNMRLCWISHFFFTLTHFTSAAIHHHEQYERGKAELCNIQGQQHHRGRRFRCGVPGKKPHCNSTTCRTMPPPSPGRTPTQRTNTTDRYDMSFSSPPPRTERP
jgi:hypothetical protein